MCPLPSELTVFKFTKFFRSISFGFLINKAVQPKQWYLSVFSVRYSIFKAIKPKWEPQCKLTSTKVQSQKNNTKKNYFRKSTTTGRELSLIWRTIQHFPKFKYFCCPFSFACSQSFGCSHWHKCQYGDGDIYVNSVISDFPESPNWPLKCVCVSVCVCVCDTSTNDLWTLKRSGPLYRQGSGRCLIGTRMEGSLLVSHCQSLRRQWHRGLCDSLSPSPPSPRETRIEREDWGGGETSAGEQRVDKEQK